MASRISLAGALVLSCASLACVGDDTVAGGSPGVQGGSGPPPSSYDATVDGQGGGEDAAPDAAGADGGDARASDAGDARASDAMSADASGPDAAIDASDAAQADAGDAADRD